MNTIDPRASHWLAQKNALTARYLAAVAGQAQRIESAYKKGSLASDMDAAMICAIPALKFINKAYDLSSEAYNAANSEFFIFINRLDKPAQNKLTEKYQRCSKIFSAAHAFWETQLGYLTYAKPDNSLDFIAFTYGTDPEGNSNKPAKQLFQLRTEQVHVSTPRIELSPMHKSTYEGDPTILSLERDWNGTGVITRNIKLNPESHYTAYYFNIGLGARGRFIETGPHHTKPLLGNMTGWRT